MSAIGPTRRLSPGCITFLLPCLAASSVACPADDHDFAAAHRLAQEAVAAGTTPSIAFAIARDGVILHEGAYGLADREAGRAATVRTAFPLASATKPITATALMVLHERQGLDLDQALRTAIPDLVVTGEHADRITLTQLLNHTSGLGNYARIRYGTAAIDAAPDLLDDVRSHAIAVNAPGRIAEYSNLGYGLLGEVVARHAKQPFATVVENLVFEPLGRDDAFIDTPRHDTAFHHYYGNAYYGLGWYVREEDGGHRVVWHEGGMPGARCSATAPMPTN